MNSIRAITLAVLASLSLSATAHAGGHHVYAMSNAKDGNEIAVLSQSADGHLTTVGRFSTMGKGSGVGEAVGVDPLGSQNSLLISDDGCWLFAVNAGSNQISVFHVTPNGLKLTSVVSSGGDYPVSIAQNGDKIYVLNAGGDGNVTGFYLGDGGRLHAIPGSKRSLNAATPQVLQQPNILLSPAQIQVTPDHRWLVVTDKNLGSQGTIQLWGIKPGGYLSSKPVVTQSGDALPFGFTFDKAGHLLMTEAFGAAMSSYDVSYSGALKPITSSLTNGQAATCWIDGNRRYFYVTNTVSDTITGYRVDEEGRLSLIDANGITATLPAGYAPTDVKLSRGGQFVNVVNSGSGKVVSYKINADDGKLTFVDEAYLFAPSSGMEGLAAD